MSKRILTLTSLCHLIPHTRDPFSRFHFSYIVTRVYVLSETYCLELVHHFTFDALVYTKNDRFTKTGAGQT